MKGTNKSNTNGNHRTGIIICEAIIILFMIVTFAYIFMTRSHWIEECEVRYPDIIVSDTGWERVFLNGPRNPIELPYKKEVKAGEMMVFENTVPEDVTDKFYFSTLAQKVNISVYVGDELRLKVVQTDKYFYWKDVITRYVYAPVYKADAGKTIRIEAYSNSGGIRPFSFALYGERASIDRTYMHMQGPAFAFTILFACMSVACIFFGIFLRVATQGRSRIDFVAWALLMMAIYCATQGEFRCFLFANLSGIHGVSGVMLVLIPMTISLYFDSVQEGRYRRCYMGYIITGGCYLSLCVILSLLRVVDMEQQLPGLLLFVAAIFAIFEYTSAKDRKAGNSYDYGIILWAVRAHMIFTMVHAYLYVSGDNLGGLFTELGFFILTCVAFYHSFRTVLDLEEQKRQVQYEAELKSKFLATMSHEIRTPINAVLGFNEAIIKESKEENIVSYARDVEGAGNLLLSLINDILDFSKLDSGNVSISQAPYSVKGLVIACYNLVERLAREKNLKLVVQVDETMPSELLGDDTRIVQIITNLLTNAIKYTRNGRIGLKVYCEGVTDKFADLKIEVSDTGIGIKEEDKSRLFNVFSRLENDVNATIGGKGLGLAIVGRLVNLMDGTIEVASTYGLGSVFTVTLPQGISDHRPVGKLDNDTFKPQGPENGKQDLFTTGDVKILAVDDVLVNLKVVQSLLKKTGIEIDTAISGEECIKKARATKYDVILLDHMMPGKDGVETLHEMKADPECKNTDTPVIVLTANAIHGAREEYLRQGFSDYLSKPIALKDLEAMLLKYLPEDKIGKEVKEEVSEVNKSNLVESEKKISVIEREEDRLSIEAVIDRKTAMENCHYNEAVWRERVETYLREDKRAMLDASYRKNDLVNYAMIVRAIRSSSATLGALALSEKALEVEHLVKEGNKELLEDGHIELTEAYGTVINALTRI